MEGSVRTTREYRGVAIMPMGRNNWGGRWEARMDVPGGGKRVAADTLAGIKEGIREVLAKQGLRRQA